MRTIPKPGADGGPGGHDLAVDPSGTLRPGWDRVLAPLLALGPEELARRQHAADRLVLAEGAGAVLHEDTTETLRPWRIDVVPLVLDAGTWAGLAAGLAERAEVLAAVVADLFGPRLLLRAGVVPVEALATHATTLRSAWFASGGPRLVVAGADVVVDASGAFRVVADATDVTGGDGHALLARSISTRVLPPAPPSLGLQDHRGYTRALRSVLAGAAPAAAAGPRTVVLTGPPEEPGFVENAYLATRLGYNLAESADVVVRGGRAWLRSLDGLEPIDVLLRRIPETDLDPVEDDRVAGAGMAGVVEAVRDHGVAMVNPHGAGVAASPALQPFLDAAARFLTGRPLRLPSVPSAWCGDPDARAAVLGALDRWVLHDTDPRAAEPPAVGAELGDAEAAAWSERIAARPERYVAQEVIALAGAPRLVGGELGAATVSLRTQVLLPDDGGAPVVLPGGHGRLVESGRPIATRRGGIGKDVWVLDPERRERVVAGPAIPQVDLRRSLPTRAAEAMYWTGRTAERAEMAARTVLVCLTRLGAHPEPDDLVAVGRALRAVGGGLAADLDGGSADLEAEVRRTLTGRTGSVVASLRATTANARAARQLLSSGTWRLLAMLDAEAAALDKLAGDPGVDLAESALVAFDATEALDRVLVPLAALSGLADESVVRGPAWRFLDIGRRIERSLLVLGLLEALFEPLPEAASTAVRGDLALAACESLVAYRRLHRSDITLDALGGLLLADRDNPRSVRFQLDQLVVDLHDLPDRSVRRRQIAAVRRTQRVIDAHLPLALPGRGARARGPVGRLVVAAREPVLDVGDMIPRGWFSERLVRIR
jgi:uncharacterized circularly permuted ATP-grasp superfamily protein/uncharacterized alpha-E superfamily protein